MQVVQEVLHCVVYARGTPKQVITLMELLITLLSIRVMMSFKAAIENVIDEVA